jgi:hypothetical protein
MSYPKIPNIETPPQNGITLYLAPSPYLGRPSSFSASTVFFRAFHPRELNQAHAQPFPLPPFKQLAPHQALWYYFRVYTIHWSGKVMPGTPETSHRLRFASLPHDCPLLQLFLLFNSVLSRGHCPERNIGPDWSKKRAHGHSHTLSGTRPRLGRGKKGFVHEGLVLF